MPWLGELADGYQPEVLQAKLARRIARRAEGGTGGDSHGAEHAVARAHSTIGEPLPAELASKFERSLGAPLGDVRVHTGEESQKAAESVGAQAYATGKDIHFAAGRYAPSTPAGEELLAHEVAHTVQQAPVSSAAMQHKLEVTEPGDACENEADAAAQRMVRGEAATVGAHSPSVSRNPANASHRGDQGQLPGPTDHRAFDPVAGPHAPATPAPASPRAAAPAATPQAPTITHTAAAPPSNDRTTVGVGEMVGFQSSVEGTWTASAAKVGTAVTGSGREYNWNAPVTADTVTISFAPTAATQGQGAAPAAPAPAPVRMTVIAPTGVSFSRTTPADPFARGVVGAKMSNHVSLTPSAGVSFGQCYWKEIGGGASGFVPNFAASWVPAHTPQLDWLEANPELRDEAEFHYEYAATDRERLVGGFEYVIPNHYLVDGEPFSSNGHQITDVRQAVRVENGPDPAAPTVTTTTITKGTPAGSVSVSRHSTPGPPAAPAAPPAHAAPAAPRAGRAGGGHHH